MFTTYEADPSYVMIHRADCGQVRKLHADGFVDHVDLARIIRCAVTRRHSSAGANPARQLSLQPVAVGADDGGNDIG